MGKSKSYKKRGHQRARGAAAVKPLAGFGDVTLRRYAVAGGVLLFALAAAHFDTFPLVLHVYFNWYLNYDCGYVARGLVGTIVKFIHGGFLPLEEMNTLAIAGKDVAQTLSMILLWLLLVPRILHVKRPPRAVWFLLAFAAMALLAPLWKAVSFQHGLLDEFVFLFALSAMAALIGRRPLLFALCLIVGFMIHRLMLAYAVLLSLMVAHACMVNPAAAARRRAWGAALAGVWAVIFLLLALADNETSLCSLEKSPLPAHDGGRMGVKVYHDLDLMLAYQLNKWNLFLPAVVPLAAFFFLPQLLTAVLFIWGCGKAGMRAPAAAENRAARLLTDGRWFPLLAVFCTLPMHLVAFDTIRIFYWSWFGFALSLVYGVWFFAPEERAPAKPAPKKPRASAPAWIAAFVALSAYAYGGMPLLWGNVAFPNLFNQPCRAWCLYPLTVNPLGALWKDAVVGGFRRSLAPYVADGGQLLQMHYVTLHALRGLRAEGGALHVPASLNGEIFTEGLILAEGESFEYGIKHDGGGDALSLALIRRQPTIQQTVLRPTTAEDGRLVWKYRVDTDSWYSFHLLTSGGADFTIKEVSLDYER